MNTETLHTAQLMAAVSTVWNVKMKMRNDMIWHSILYKQGTAQQHAGFCWLYTGFRCICWCGINPVTPYRALQILATASIITLSNRLHRIVSYFHCCHPTSVGVDVICVAGSSSLVVTLSVRRWNLVAQYLLLVASVLVSSNCPHYFWYHHCFGNILFFKVSATLWTLLMD